MRGIAGTQRHTQAHARGQWTITKARCLIRSRAGGRVESSDCRELGNMINDGGGRADNTLPYRECWWWFCLGEESQWCV